MIPSFEPTLPSQRIAPLLERAAELVKVTRPFASVPSATAEPLRPLLRAMNSYYTNRIEGQHTKPADLARALNKDFDADSALARRQRIALVHMEAEQELEPRVSLPALYSAMQVGEVHNAIYRRLQPQDRLTDEGAVIEPGVFRAIDVAAGQHRAPDWQHVRALVDTWGARYAHVAGTEHAIIAAACAHHRLLWIHPFADGNGRTARLFTHLTLHALGLTHGLWSPLRGIARNVESYYARLNNADLPRRNDLDGRGALSEEELTNFATWMIDICIDQARFMGELLTFSEMKPRLADLLRHLEAHPWDIGSERSVVSLQALEALHYVMLTGPLDRTRFMQMTGLAPTTARRVLRSLLDYGVLRADTSRAPVELALPFKSLRFLFPRLWPEAEVD